MHASWSLDNSLLCVTFGPHAILYESASYVLRQVLTSPNTKPALSSQFVGHNGRYLVTVGIWDVVLWDLPAQSGEWLCNLSIHPCTDKVSVRWQYKSPWPIEKLLSHHWSNAFAIIHVPSISLNSKRRTTPISIFRTSSSTPYQKYTVPFGFLNVTHQATRPSISPSDAPKFAFVGITHQYNVVFVGDDVSTPVDEGATGKSIIKGFASNPRKTLFQDIFGASAFIDLSNSPTAFEPASTQDISNVPWSRKGAATLFDAPAYLMPPIGSLFDSAMDELLRARTDEQNRDPDEHSQQDDDIEMNRQSDEEVTLGAHLTRVVDQREMDLFIDLFKRTKG